MDKSIFNRVYNNIVIKRYILALIRSFRGGKRSFSYEVAKNKSIQWMCRYGYIGLLLERLESEKNENTISLTDSMINDFCEFVSSWHIFTRVYELVKDEMDALATRSTIPFTNICKNLVISSNDRLKILNFIRNQDQDNQQLSDGNNNNNNLENNNDNVDSNIDNNNSNNRIKWKASNNNLVTSIVTKDYQLFNYLKVNGLVGDGSLLMALNMKDKKLIDLALENDKESSLLITDSALFALGKMGDLELIKKMEPYISKYIARNLLDGAIQSGNLDCVEYIIGKNTKTSLTPNITHQYLMSAVRGGNHLVFTKVLQLFPVPVSQDVLALACKLGKSLQMVVCIVDTILAYSDATRESTITPRVIESACVSGNREIVLYLLNGGELTMFQRSLAAKNGHIELLHLPHTESFNLISSDTLTIAAFRGHYRVLEYLLLKLVEMNTLDSTYLYDGVIGITLQLPRAYYKKSFGPLEAATYAGHFNIVKLICGFVQQLTQGVKSKSLKIAVHCGHYDILEYFILEMKIPLESDALVLAAENGYYDMVQLLVENQCPMSCKAIDLAASNGYIQIVKYLIHHNCPCSTRAMDGAAEMGLLGMVKYLHHQYKRCTTNALLSAVKNNDLRMVKFIKENCKVITLGRIKSTQNDQYMGQALDYAYRMGYKEVMEYLIETNDYRFTSVSYQWAIRYNDIEMIKYLINQNVKISTKVIDLAVDCGRLNILKYIRENYKADVLCCSRYALEYAIANGEEFTLDYLLEHFTIRTWGGLTFMVCQMVKRHQAPHVIVKLLTHSKVVPLLWMNKIESVAIEFNNHVILHSIKLL